MKKLIMIFSVLLVNMIYSQNNFRNKSALSFNPNFPIAVGDNFLSKAYSNNVGVALEYQYNFKSFFFGLNYEFGNETIRDKNLMGNFKSSKSNNAIWFIGFRQKLTNPKRYLEYKLGSGKKTIINQTNINEYQIEGESWVLGSKFNYILNKNVHVVAGLEYKYTCYEVKMEGPYQDFYSTSKQLTPTVGLKFLF
jgi:hypothetical protein